LMIFITPIPSISAIPVLPPFPATISIVPNATIVAFAYVLIGGFFLPDRRLRFLYSGHTIIL
jgi:hypothetical protein